MALRIPGNIGEQCLEQRREGGRERRVEIGVAAARGFAESRRIGLGEAREQEPRVVVGASHCRIDLGPVDRRDRAIEIPTRVGKAKPREPSDRRGVACRKECDREPPDLASRRD